MRALRSSATIGSAVVPARRASFPGAPRGGSGPVPFPECDLRRSPGTVGLGPASPAWVLAGAARGVSGGGSAGSGWEGKKGERERGPRRWNFAVTHPPPCSRSGLGRVPRAAAGCGGEVKEAANPERCSG